MTLRRRIAVTNPEIRTQAGVIRFPAPAVPLRCGSCGGCTFLIGREPDGRVTAIKCAEAYCLAEVQVGEQPE